MLKPDGFENFRLASQQDAVLPQSLTLPQGVFRRCACDLRMVILF
jgi:hypothetical protein